MEVSLLGCRTSGGNIRYGCGANKISRTCPSVSPKLLTREFLVASVPESSISVRVLGREKALKLSGEYYLPRVGGYTQCSLFLKMR